MRQVRARSARPKNAYDGDGDSIVDVSERESSERDRYIRTWRRMKLQSFLFRTGIGGVLLLLFALANEFFGPIATFARRRHRRRRCFSRDHHLSALPSFSKVPSVWQAFFRRELDQVARL